MKNFIVILAIFASFSALSQQILELNWEKIHQIEPDENILAITQSNDTLYGIGANFTQISTDDGSTWKKVCTSILSETKIYTTSKEKAILRKTISGDGTYSSRFIYETYSQKKCNTDSITQENRYNGSGFFNAPISDGVYTYKHKILANGDHMYFRKSFHQADPVDNGNIYNREIINFIINDNSFNLITNYFDTSTAQRIYSKHPNFNILSNIKNCLGANLTSIVNDTLYLIDSSDLAIISKKVLPSKNLYPKYDIYENEIYYNIGNDKLYKSPDEGDNWEEIQLNIDEQVSFYEIKNGVHIIRTQINDYIGTNPTDLHITPSYRKSLSYFVFDDLILATLKNSNTLFRSFDMGISWDTIYTNNKIHYLNDNIFTIKQNNVFILDGNNVEQIANNYHFLNVPGEIHQLGELIIQKKRIGLNEVEFSKYDNQLDEWIPLKKGNKNFKLLTKNIKNDQLIAYAKDSIYISSDAGNSWVPTVFNIDNKIVTSILAVKDTIVIIKYDKIYSKTGSGNWKNHGYVGAYAKAIFFNNAIYVAGETISKYTDINENPIKFGDLSSNVVSRYRIHVFDGFIAISKYKNLYLLDKFDQLHSIQQNLTEITNLHMKGDDLYTIVKDTSIWKTTIKLCENNFVGASCDDNNPNTLYDTIQDDCECKGQVIETTCSEQNKAILFKFYTKLNGPNWTIKNNWLSDRPLHEWHGVRTDSNGCVIVLDLKFNNLAGELPEEIGQLEQLQNLTLHNNHITGNIPSSINNLQHLDRCYLSYNNLSGCFPDLPNICPMKYNYSYTKGHFGDEIAHYEDKGYNFTNNDLLPLQGDFQKICEGKEQIGAPCEAGDRFENAYIQTDCSCVGLPTNESPCRVNDSTTLHRIYSFGGGNSKWENWNTDASLRKWDGITTDDDGCVTEIFTYQFHKLPSAVGDLVHLKKIKLGGSTGLIGKLPKTIGKLENLESLIISGKMTGEIPKEIGNLSNLKELILHNNEFTKIPKEIGNLKSLEKMLLGSNNLTGEIPKEIGNLENLISLGLSQNELSGEIPVEITNLSKLEGLSLGSNQLSGEIPKEIGNLTQLKSLRLGWNQLSGQIPKEIEKLTHLKSINLSLNFLNDSFPIELTNLSDLVSISLANNHIWGVLPHEITNLTHLKYLNIRDNFLIGTLPENIGDLSSLEHIDLRNNELSGILPAGLASLSDLEILFLENNNFSGCLDQGILDSFCNNKNIRFDLFGNNLLPFQGSFRQICDSHSQIGAPCSDQDSTSLNDIINEDCTCSGTIVSTQNISNFTKLKIQPNPNNGQFTLLLKVRKKTSIKISVHSLMGKTLFMKEIQGNDLKEKINLTHLSSGIYFLQVSTDDEILTEKIIIDY